MNISNGTSQPSTPHKPDAFNSTTKKSQWSCGKILSSISARFQAIERGDFSVDDNESDAYRTVRGASPEFNARFNYCDNSIKTSRYTLLTFIPLNLFEQFLRIANIYFLILVILQSFPLISPVSPLAQAMSLAFIIVLTALKYGFDDIIRHRSDTKINSRPAMILGPRCDEQPVQWCKILVGQVVMLKNNEHVPADLLLLSSSGANGLCFVETAELDGETNLKYRQSLEQTQAIGNDMQRLGTFQGQVHCEGPNIRLAKFDGRLDWLGKSYSLNNNNILLRGCTIRNTEWAYGLVVYTGRQTKLMKNTGKATLKRTHIDRLSNKLFLGIFGLMFVLLVVAAILGFIFESGIGSQFKESYSVWMDISGINPAMIGAIQFFSHIILIQYLVPISLYITFEGIQAILSRVYINYDIEMYHPESDIAASARSTSLNEDLGQVSYIFSDKTGTLTQNIMTFNACSIAGKKYGKKDGERHEIDFSKHEPKYWDPSFKFFDRTLLEEILKNDLSAVHDFFMLLSLCHTLNAEFEDDGKRLVYKAQSPDEAALVTAARNFGFVYKSRTPSSMVIDVFGVEKSYNLLCVLEFDNVRKRMSIVVADEEGKKKLLCKGADSSILPVLGNATSSALIDKTKDHLHEFATEGLRTLCCASKDVDDQEWVSWLDKYKTASTALEDRDQKLTDCYLDMERDLNLIGATAVEDKLQDGVPETIFKLKAAGIKVWVLTGDKQETAINIGHSCCMLNEKTTELIVDCEDFSGVEQQLIDIQRQIDAHALSGSYGVMDYALIINGHSLYHALSKELEDFFLSIACSCQAVICCRVAPLQKGLVVSLVKRKKNAITLAIGDGANDVSMIKTAQIGVGISGLEGRQAVLASDFSIAQFRFLQRLLLVHGRWAYSRVSLFMCYFFYKTFALAICQYWFGIYCGWSATALFDQWFLSAYNVTYTALPVLYLALFEQDVTDRDSLTYPKLYQPGLTNKFFNLPRFVLAEAEGVLQSALAFFLMKYGFGEFMMPDGNSIATSRASVGIAVGSTLVFAVTARISLETTFWSYINVTPLISIILVFLLQYVTATVLARIQLEFDFYNVATAVWASPNFWFISILVLATTCLPVVFVRSVFFIFKPSLPQRIQFRRWILNNCRGDDQAVAVRDDTQHEFELRPRHQSFAII